MRLPLINIPTIYHVGTLNPDERGKQHSDSYEGRWLSASLCPDAWIKIAKLGDSPVWEVGRPDALYLDAYAMGISADEVYDWAQRNELIREASVYRVDYFDSELDAWCTTHHMTEDAAQAEIRALHELGGESAKFRLSEDAIWVLTDIGNQRAKQSAEVLREANDFALQFWVEDVLREDMPQVVGIYWDERYDPDLYSAPRAAIVPEALSSMRVSHARYFDEDEELLERLPKPMLLWPQDLSSPYRYVINCVSADGGSINAMTDDPSCSDLSYEEFLEAMGEGAEQLLDETFPDYEGTKEMGLTLGTDWAVSFHASSYEGAPCLFVRHSGIEYVFQRAAMVDAPRFQFSRSIRPASSLNI